MEGLSDVIQRFNERIYTLRRRLACGLAALTVVAAGGCTVALPPPEATPSERYEWSRQRYDEEKYHDAIRGFRDLLFREPLHATSDSARYLLADSYFRTGDHLLAANEFRMLATSRPNSEVADEAQFGMCRAYWEMSPSIPRDQDFTRRAIDACTRLMEFFPRSPLIPEAELLISEANEKLAAKQARVGTWYFDRKLYESSIIYFEAIVQEFPQAEVIPEVLLRLHDSYSEVGFRAEAETVRGILLERFPDSPEARRFAPDGDQVPATAGQ